MIAPLRAAELISALYGDANGIKTVFSHVDSGADDGVYYGIAQEPDCDVVVLRGSVTPEDWIIDSMAGPYFDRRFGAVHHGFYLGMANVADEVQEIRRRDLPLVISGHSLGAARAAVLTAIMVSSEIVPAARIVFGEPKPGFSQLGAFIKGVPGWSFCNGDASGHDIVTELPLTMARIGLNYSHPSPLISVTGSPDPGDQSGLFVYHHFPLYLRAMRGLKP